MSWKDIGKRILTILPRTIKKEVKKNRNSTPFLMSISFLISLISARLWVVLTKANETTQTSNITYSVGKNLILGGYHIHHITYGVILLTISAWLSINYWSRSMARISSILYGAGLGLIVDEIGFIVEGIEPYEADSEVFYLAVLLIGSLLSIVYFPSFYQSIKRDIKKWKRILFD